MGHTIADTVIARHAKRLKGQVRCITIDMDPTDDPTYGSQQLTFFTKHYDNWCYLPAACFLQFDNEADQYAFGYVLRPADCSAHYSAISILQQTICKLRKAFDRVKIRVRLDGGFCSPEVFEFLDAQKVQYVVAIGQNSVLKAFAEPRWIKPCVIPQHQIRANTILVSVTTKLEAGTMSDVSSSKLKSFGNQVDIPEIISALLLPI